MTFRDALINEFGERPFTAADVLERVPPTAMPALVQLALERAEHGMIKRPLSSIGQCLGRTPGVRNLGRTSKGAVWRIVKIS